MNYARKPIKKKSNIKGTTIALIVMAVLDILFTVAMIWLFYLYQDVPDALIVAVFGVTFGECGFCTLIYKVKKGIVMKENPITIGDITGFDDAEVLDDGIHRTNFSGKTKTVRDTRYEELEDTGELDSKSGTD